MTGEVRETAKLYKKFIDRQKTDQVKLPDFELYQHESIGLRAAFHRLLTGETLTYEQAESLDIGWLSTIAQLEQAILFEAGR